MTAILRALTLALLAFVPLVTRTSWQWYRRLHGGRWSPLLSERWGPVPRCPGPLHSDIIDMGPMPAGLCFDDGTERACFCEP